MRADSFSMRRSLPPLRPSQTTIKIEQSGMKFTDFIQKSQLIEKARTTVTTLDLNDIIHELEEIFERDMQAMQYLTDSNQRKADELANERCQFEARKLQFETARANTAILEVLKKQDLAGKSARLMETILSLDSERRAQKPPPMGVEPKDVFARQESELLKWLHLKELVFREVESVVYLLKKRVISVDQSERVVAEIQKKFNSIQNLADLARRLETENSQLRESERGFIADALTRRRPLTRVSPFGSRSIVPVLQASVDDLCQYGAWLEWHLSAGTRPDFDSVCGDCAFSLQTALNFDDEIKPGLSPEQVLDALQELVAQTDTASMKILPQPSACPDFAPPGPAPLEVLQRQNNECFLALRSCQTLVDRLQSESVSVVRAILSAITERRRYQYRRARLLKSYRMLQDPHIDLFDRISLNTSITTSLQAISCLFGRLLVDGLDDPDLDDIVLKNCVVVEKPPTPPQPSPKKKRRRAHGTRAQSRQSFPVGPLDLLVHAPRYAFIAALELATTAIGQRKPVIIPAITERLIDLRTDLARVIAGIDGWERENIGQIRELSDRMLRREHADKDIQAVLLQRQGQEVQAVETKRVRW
jgi:hypothetical protein